MSPSDVVFACLRGVPIYHNALTLTAEYHTKANSAVIYDKVAGQLVLKCNLSEGR